MSKSRFIKVNVSDEITTKPFISSFECEVIRWGNGAGVLLPKRFLNYKVLVLVLEGKEG